MFLRRLDETSPIHRLRDEMDRLFGEFLPDVSFDFGWARGFPALNVWEDEQNVFVEAELPGLTMSDIELTVLGGELTIKGERKLEEPKDATVHRRERMTGSFLRSLSLPVDIDADHVTAELHQGVLRVTLPKSPTARPRRIEVKALDK
ncbi:MAG: Hsp20/alpha crystallin family protein [Phycisphaerae bacterium]